MYEMSKKIANAHDEGIWSVSWTGDVIATGGMGQRVKTWNGNRVATNFLTERKPFGHHLLGVSSIDIDSSSQFLATSGLDSHIRLWNLNDNSLSKDIDVGPFGTWSLAFSPKGDTLVSVSHTGSICLWSTATGDRLQNYQSGTKSSIFSVAFSPDGRDIACGGSDGVVSIFEVETGKRINNIEAHACPIRTLCYSKDSNTLFTGSDDSQINLFDPQSGAGAIASLQGHSSWVLSVNSSSNGKNLASGSSDKKVKIWDISTRKCEHTFNDHADQVWGVAWSPDSTKLVSVSDDCSIIAYTIKQ